MPEAVNRGVWFIRTWDIILFLGERVWGWNEDSRLREKNISCFQLHKTEVGIWQSLASKGKAMDGGPFGYSQLLNSCPFSLWVQCIQLGHIGTDCGKSYCGVISVTALLLVETFYIKFACRNRGGCVEGSMAFHIVGKLLWKVLNFFPFMSSHHCLCSSKEVLSLKAADKGAFLSHETLIWVIFKGESIFCW